MELINLTRYLPVTEPQAIHPFSDLRLLKPVLLSQDLRLEGAQENEAYVQELAAKGLAVVPCRRLPPAKYINRNTFPRRMIVEMTSKCNFLCRMCPRHKMTRPVMDMPVELYKKILDEADHYGIEGLWLYHLGEPVLHPGFGDIVDYVNTKKHLGVIWLSTNGRHFTADKIRQVLSSNISYINFSAHAVTEETYNTVAPPGNFLIVQENLEKLYSLKGPSSAPRPPFLHIQMIEQETTRHEVDAFVERHFRRADIVSVNMLEYVNLENNAFGFRQRNRGPLQTCARVCRQDCFVFSNGEVTLCDAAFNGELSLGNASNDSLFAIWNGQKRREIMEKNFAGRMNQIEFCQTCTDYDI